MGLFRRLFGGDPAAPADPLRPGQEAAPQAAEPQPAAVVVLRRGMNVPSEDYVATVVTAAGFAPSIPRFGLSQPSWFKTDETAEAIAAEVAQTFATKLALPAHSHVKRTVAGPEGCPVLLVAIFPG